MHRGVSVLAMPTGNTIMFTTAVDFVTGSEASALQESVKVSPRQMPRLRQRLQANAYRHQVGDTEVNAAEAFDPSDVRYHPKSCGPRRHRGNELMTVEMSR